MRYLFGLDRSRGRGLLWLVLLLGGAILPAAAALDGKAWLLAYQAYLRQDFSTAQQGFAALLQDELTATEKAEILSYHAKSLQQLDRPAEAAAALEALLQVMPDTPHFDELAFLYRYYLENGEVQKAEMLWDTVIQRWGKTSGIWKLVAAHTDYLAQHNPMLVVQCAEQLVPLAIAKEDLLTAFYQPLFRYGHFGQAREVHALLQQYFAAHRPAVVELDKRAYEDAISENIVAAYFARFSAALQADDLEAARSWLANLNGTVPEHPHAVEARKLYREKMQASQQGDQ